MSKVIQKYYGAAFAFLFLGSSLPAMQRMVPDPEMEQLGERTYQRIASSKDIGDFLDVMEDIQDEATPELTVQLLREFERRFKHEIVKDNGSHGSTSRIHDVVSSPDGNFAALLASNLGIVYLPLNLFVYHQRLDFSLDKKSIVFNPQSTEVAYSNGVVLVYVRLLGGSKTEKFLEHDNLITQVAFDPSGEKLCTTGRDWKIVIRYIHRDPLEKEILNHECPVYALAFIDDNTLATSGDTQVKIWNLEDSTLVRELDSIKGYLLNYHASSGKLVALQSEQGGTALRVWDTHGLDIPSLKSGKNDIEFREIRINKLGSHALLYSRDYIALYDLSRARLVLQTKTKHNRCHSEEILAFTPDGKMVVRGNADGGFDFLNLNGEVVESFPCVHTLTYGDRAVPFTGDEHPSRITQVVSDNAENVMYLATRVCRIFALDPRSRTIIGEMPVTRGPDNLAFMVTVSSDGKYLFKVGDHFHVYDVLAPWQPDPFSAGALGFITEQLKKYKRGEASPDEVREKTDDFLNCDLVYMVSPKEEQAMLIQKIYDKREEFGVNGIFDGVKKELWYMPFTYNSTKASLALTGLQAGMLYYSVYHAPRKVSVGLGVLQLLISAVRYCIK